MDKTNNIKAKLEENLEKLNNKKMAQIIWIISAIYAVSYVLFYLVQAPEYLIVGIGAAVLPLIAQFVLGFAIFRGKNDGITIISVLFAAIAFNLAGLVAIIMRLILRKKTDNDKEKIRELWHIPVIVAVCLSLISMLTNFSILSIIAVLFNLIFYIVFSYWFIKVLK